ncbi:MAG TPA: kelch repeat-containing protein [Polyangiales bacterium]|nr:kelch repeat-containing protein [Polyangiales bacterium]
MPRAVTSFGAAELAGNVYAFGGYFGVPHAYNRDGQSGELWRLEPGGRSFELLANAEPTQGAALVALGNALLRVGGMRAKNALGQPDDIHSLDEVASFSPETRAWTPLLALPTARSSHAAAVIGSTVYVVGGWKLEGNAQSGTFADSMLALDLQNGWRTLPQPFQKRALAAAALDGKLVVIGGIDASGELSREVHVFDPSAGWTRGPDFPADAFGVAASSDGNTLYASARDGQLYALSEAHGTWQTSKKLVFPRFFHQLVQVGPTKLLALGGISGMHAGPRIREVEDVDLTAGAPLRVLSFTTSNPLAGRNRQGVFVHGDALYAFGGNRSLAQHDFKPEDFSDDAGRFDLAALAWAPIAKFPIPRQTLQTLVTDERGLAIGGFGHDAPPKGEAHAHADAYSYDFEKGTWSPDPSVLPTPRTQFGLTSFQGARWVFGGLDFKPEAQGEAQFDHPTSVLRAEPDKPFAASGVELPRPRRAFGGAVLDGKYYMVGGMAGGFQTIDRCDVFEFATQKWSEISCPATRISPQLVALDGKLYLAGGSSAGPGGQLTPNASLEVFDPATNTWTTLLPTLPIEPRHLSMLPYAGGLLLYSAHDEQGRAHFALIKP